MTTSKLLILTHYTHTEIFLKEAEILTSYTNMTFEKCDKILQYDLKDILKDVKIN